MCVCVYTHICHSGLLLCHKKKEIMLFALTWMDQDIIIQSKVSQENVTYTWTLKKMVKMSLFSKQKQTHGLRGKNSWLLKGKTGKME